MEGPVVPHVLRQSARWLVKKVVVQAETQSQDPHLRACRCHMNGNTHFEGLLCRCFGGCVIYKASRGCCFPVTSCFQSWFYLADRTNQAFDIYSMVKRWMDGWMDERSIDDNRDTDRSIYIRRLLTGWMDALMAGCTDVQMADGWIYGSLQIKCFLNDTRIDVWIGSRMDKEMAEWEWIRGRMCKWFDRCLDGEMNGWITTWVDVQKEGCVIWWRGRLNESTDGLNDGWMAGWINW